ncbi:MAG: glycine cleavage system protein GcvH [Deltaproteobacteria bacterium]|nr:glycine cleavage system protein GcvH [Deltaproteobacteria bacterium]
MADYEIPADLRYTREDEWARVEGERVTIGVTDYAQQQLGDIVNVELPAVGTAVERGEPFGVIESVKAVSDLYAPVTGEVVEANADLANHPEHVNEDCYGDGWMLSIRVADAAEIETLISAAEYRRHVEDRSTE